VARATQLPWSCSSLAEAQSGLDILRSRFAPRGRQTIAGTTLSSGILIITAVTTAAATIRRDFLFYAHETFRVSKQGGTHPSTFLDVRSSIVRRPFCKGAILKMTRFFLIGCLLISSMFQARAIDDEEFVNMTAVRQKFSLGERDELSPEAFTFAVAVRDRMRANRAILQNVVGNPSHIYHQMDCSYGRFSEVDFLGVSFQKSDFSHCLFDKVRFILGEFIDSNCQHMVFLNSSILGGEFTRCDLSNRRFDHVDFGSPESVRQMCDVALDWIREEPTLLENRKVADFVNSIESGYSDHILSLPQSAPAA